MTSSSGPDPRVLVVGAGPTGLALAAFLTANGIQPRVIDRSLERVGESRALAIQPRTLEVLAGLGITDKLVEAGNKNVQLRLHAPGRTHTVAMYGLDLPGTAYPYLLFLSQAETERILAEHLTDAGVTVERGTELTGLTQDADQAVATLRHPDGRAEQISVSYVVGCDGGHSSVRQHTGIAFEGGSYPQTFVLADVNADGIEPGAAHVYLSEQGMLFFFPLVHPAAWRLLAMRPRNDPTPAGAPLELNEVQRLADAYTGGSVRLRNPVWMTNFRLHHRAAAQYRRGRIFLAGDAAHIHSPAGAQGMNTGIQDAANLAWKLAHTLHGCAPTFILDTYDTERAPIGRAVLRMSDRAFTIATSTNPLIRFARTRIAPAAISLGAKASKPRAYLFATVSELNIRYRHSPLSTTGPGAPHRLRAGDRLPDGQLTHDLRLHQLTAATGWHLLATGLASQELQHLEDLPDRRRAPITAHRLEPAAARRALTGLTVVAGRPMLILVRPDGHIGYLGSSIPDLTSYLDRWVLARS